MKLYSESSFCSVKHGFQQIFNQPVNQRVICTPQYILWSTIMLSSHSRLQFALLVSDELRYGSEPRTDRDWLAHPMHKKGIVTAFVQVNVKKLYGETGCRYSERSESNSARSSCGSVRLLVRQSKKCWCVQFCAIFASSSPLSPLHVLLECCTISMCQTVV